MIYLVYLPTSVSIKVDKIGGTLSISEASYWACIIHSIFTAI